MAVESINGGGESLPQISEYRVVGLVAKGAMGEVYKALDPILNRDVAIKILSPALLDDEDATGRFQREAKATARIRHKNVAIIYSVGKTGAGVPYMAMEFIDGTPLADIIQNKTPVIFSQAVEFLIQCCQGLEAAKREGIIHRDIKPSNIMILPNGEVKLVDFGLAKIFRDESFRTVDNMVMGTPAYMSPEQSLGHKSIDFRSDIYSLGASFYHLLAGELPFEADSPVQLMMKHVNSPLRSINVINPKVPHDLSDIIHRMMNKDREDRFQDYEVLIHEFKKVKVTCLAKERSQGIKAAPLMTLALESANDDNPGGALTDPPPDQSKHPAAAAPPPPSQRQYSSLEDLSDEPSPFDPAYSDLQETYRIPAASSPGEYEQEVEAVQPGSPYEVGRHHDPGHINRRILDTGADATAPKPMSWLQKSIIVVLALIVAFAILAAVIKPPSSANQQTGQRKTLLSLLLQSIAGKPQRAPGDTPEMIQLAEYNRNRERLVELEIAVQQYEAREGVLPPSLRALVTNGAITNEILADSWGHRFNYIKLNRLITCNGPDGVENTSDDITLKLDGTGIQMPAQYTRLTNTVKDQSNERDRNKSRDNP